MCFLALGQNKTQPIGEGLRRIEVLFIFYQFYIIFRYL